MTDPSAQVTSSTNPGAGQLRQLAHDLRTPLSVISMGLEILKQVRHDDEQFARVMTMISAEGVEPMKTLIANVADLAASAPPSSGPR